MRQVYAPANAAEAHMLAHLLEQAGIDAHVHGEALQGAAGELPAMSTLQLMVADEDYDRARALVLEWEKTPVAAEAPEPKRRFPLGVALAAMVVGLGVGWVLRDNSSFIPFVAGTRIEVDQNRDGAVDSTLFYAPGWEYAQRAEFDNNFDGRVDFITHYDERGLSTRHEADADFDGALESRAVYESGVLDRVEVDWNNNGVADAILFHQHGIVRREEVHDGRTGRLARVNYYDAFRLERSEHDLDRDGVMETERTYDRFGEITATRTLQRR